MEVILSPERIDVQPCDILVSGFFQDERPLRGSAGWLDWRFNGMISRFLIAKRVVGAWRETILIPSQGRVSSGMVLLLGLGGLKQYNLERLRELSPYLLETLQKLKNTRVCLSFPFDGKTPVTCGKVVEVFLEACANEGSRDQARKEWVERLRLCFAEGATHFSEILSGTESAQATLQGRFPIQIVRSSERNP